MIACLCLQALSSACGFDSPGATSTDSSLGAAGSKATLDAGTARVRDAGNPDQDDAGSEPDAQKPTPVTKDASVAREDAAQAEQVDVEELSRSLARAVCGALLDCLGEQKLRAFVDNEVCEDRFAAGFAQGDLSALNDSIERGRVQLHSDALAQCYEDTRKQRCAIQTERLPSSCQKALTGTVAEGETCTTGADCAGASFCSTGECPRVCSPRRAAADSCTRDEECKSGLICIQDKCAEPAQVGDPCGGTTGAVCALGTSCVGSTTEQAGTCATNASVQVGAVDEVCTPGGKLCREGLSCAFDGDSGFVCKEPVAAGDSCYLALPTQCPNAHYCTAPDVTTEGRCARLPVEGEPCVLSGDCAGGHVCLSAGGDEVVCRRVRDLAESCEVDAMCRSGRCVEGKCAPIEVCD